MFEPTRSTRFGFLFSLVLLSCSDEPERMQFDRCEPREHGIEGPITTESLVGDWTYVQAGCIDGGCGSILVRFRSDGTLLAISDEQNLMSGVHEYSVVEDDIQVRPPAGSEDSVRVLGFTEVEVLDATTLSTESTELKSWDCDYELEVSE